ncbi:recombinase family protein [Amycolatopsis sp. NPDC089917]|uniref:recombinase family protein n=1 Tax=Amycolatopsis sp. NPDC089917 TaxID=3155187 RepID=UPI0034279291
MATFTPGVHGGSFMGRASRNRVFRAASGVLPQLRVVIYARASSDTKGRKVSVGSQISSGKAWCERAGALVVAVLVDNDLSASRYGTEVRGDYEEALRLIATGEANTLWTWENSRAQRELDTFVRMRQLLTKTGGYWAYDDRVYDMNDPDDRIDTAEDAMDAERESEKLRKRVLRGVESRARAGLWAGPVSFGFKVAYDPQTGEADRLIDPDEQPVAVELVKRLIETGNESDIARDFNARGISCARATVWRADQVRKLHDLSQDAEGWARFLDGLSSEQQASAYDALVRLRADSASQVAKDMNRAQAAHPMPGKWDSAKVRNIGLNPALAALRVWRGTIIREGSWPRIIEPEDHYAVVAKLSDPSRRWVKDGTRVKYLLSGIMLCGVCEKPVSTGKDRQHKIYKCPDGHLTRNMAKADSLVVEALLHRLASDEVRELFQIAGQAHDLSRWVKEAQDLRARLDAFTDTAIKGDLTPERLARIEASLLPKIAAAEQRAKEVGVSPVVSGLIGPQAPEVWASLPVAQKRNVVRALVRPRLQRTKGGRAPFDPKAITLSWLGRPAPIPGVDDVAEAGAA